MIMMRRQRHQHSPNLIVGVFFFAMMLSSSSSRAFSPSSHDNRIIMPRANNNNNNNNNNNILRHSAQSVSPRRTGWLPPLYSGDGIATNYQWHEEAFEIEVTVKVPKDTRAKDIHFKAKTNSIELRLLHKQQQTEHENENEEMVYLLDPSRQLRGKVVLDGTFWVISDPDSTTTTETTKDDDTTTQAEADVAEPYREVTVTIEKQIRTPKDDFDVIEYDWNGVFTDDEEEVSYRKYDEPEELDVRDYAASLGVDIDNLNMSLVDKSMFTSGLNTTKSTLDGLQKAGLMKEVTRQDDGSEWITDDEGEKVPFSTYGPAVSKDEARQTAAAATSSTGSSTPEAVAAASASSGIPFLDTDSPWHKAVPVKGLSKKDDTDDDDDVDTSHSSSSSPPQTDSAAPPSSTKDKDRADKKRQLQEQAQKDAVDPISTLTVTRLREILKERGLKVSGNKKELQDRLRSEVQSLMGSGGTD